MLVLNLTNGSDLKIKNKWNELNPTEYLFVCKNLVRLLNKTIDIDQFNLLVFGMLSGYRKSRKATSDGLATIYALAQQTRFALKEVEPGKFDTDFKMGKNLLPELLIRNKKRKTEKLQGAIFTTPDNGDLITNISTEQYIDAYNYYTHFKRTEDYSYLNSLIGVLYTTPYSTIKAQENAQHIAEIDVFIKYAVLYFFDYVIQWFAEHPVYSLLFSKGSVQKTISLGMAEVVYSMAEKGYGSKKEVAEWPVYEFFNVMIKDMTDLARSLAAKPHEKSAGEIAELMNLNLETVSKLL